MTLRRGLCEIRVIGYKRPDLLRRALGSLINQTYQNWRALVFDDSPEQEGKKVVEELGDERIVYSPNLERLGQVKNIAKAFSPHSFLGDAEYATILEDDNYYLSEYLEKNINLFRDRKCNILQSNARMAVLRATGEELLQDRFTLSPIYGTNMREIEFRERLGNILLNHAIGAGGLIWRLNRGINLQSAGELYNSVVAEKLKALSTRESFLFNPKALLVFTVFEGEGEDSKPRALWESRRFRRSELSLARRVIREMGKDGVKSLLDREKEVGEGVVLRLAESGSIAALLRLRFSRKNIVRLSKALLLWILFPLQTIDGNHSS